MNKKILNGLSLAGLSATFVGNGIGRFAYIAMMPALIQAGWFSKGEASFLGVSTLLGYLLGAPAANFLIRSYPAGVLLRAAMLMCSISYLACALQGMSMFWFYGWRILAGFGGAILMVLAAPAVLPRHSPMVRGRVSGVVFSGIGLGAMASGTLIPLLILQGVASAWVGMGILCLTLTLLVWPQWSSSLVTAVPKAVQPMSRLPDGQRWAIWLILAAYTLNAIGYLPHTLFWVDYIVRELKMPLTMGGFFWAVFGVGAAIGPLLTGKLGDALGFRRCLIGCFLLKALGVALPLWSSAPLALFVSSFLVGAFTPGIVTLVSTYTLDCVGAAHHRKAWGMMTFSFAASQAGAGYLMAYTITSWSSYRPLFLISALALLCAAACIAHIRLKSVPMVVAPSTS